MTALESWLQQATRHLSAESAAQVRTEIREHYESAREAALAAPGEHRQQLQHQSGDELPASNL